MRKTSLHWFTLALILVLFFLAGLVLLPVPLTRDQGIYSYVAWRWLGEALPYRDSFDHKGPLLYLIYALALQISGGAMWGPNLFDLLARTLTVILGYLAGRRLLSPRGGLYTAIFTALPLFGVFNSCWWNAQAETFIMPLLSAGALAASGRSGKRGETSLLAGICTGLALLLKLSVFPHLLFLALWLWRCSDPRLAADRRKRLIAPALFLLGTMLPPALAVLYFWNKGAGRSFFEIYLLFNLIHASRSLAAIPWHHLFRGLWVSANFIPLLALFLFLPMPRALRKREPLAFILLWNAAGLAQVLLQGKFFLYHWLVFLPPLGLLAGAGLARVENFFGPAGGTTAPSAGRRVGGAVVFLLCAWFILVFGRAWWLIAESYQTRRFVTGEISRREYYARFNSSDARGRGDFNLLASVAVAELARKIVPPDGRLLVFGYEPIINYLAARPAPTRFEIDYPLTFTPASPRSEKLRQKWREEFMRGLTARPPELVILVVNDANAIEPVSSLEQARAFSEFWSWLNQNYAVSERIEDFLFYRRKKD